LGGVVGWIVGDTLSYFFFAVLVLVSWVGMRWWMFGFTSPPDPQHVAKRLGRMLEHTYGKWDQVNRPEWVDQEARRLARIELGEADKGEETHSPDSSDAPR
jgi:hypothetical protein